MSWISLRVFCLLCCSYGWMLTLIGHHWGMWLKTIHQHKRTISGQCMFGAILNKLQNRKILFPFSRLLSYICSKNILNDLINSFCLSIRLKLVCETQSQSSSCFLKTWIEKSLVKLASLSLIISISNPYNHNSSFTNW